MSVIEENDGYGLGRVEEESYENFHSPSSYNELGDEPKSVDYRGLEGNDDPYLNFHPTNPFLPQNLAANMEEMPMIERNLPTSSNNRSMSLPRGFGKSNPPRTENGNAAFRNTLSKKNRVRVSSGSSPLLHCMCF